MLKKTPSNSRVLQWTSEATAAFQDIKNALADASLLVHPKPDAPVKLMTDASHIAIGAVLQHYLNDTWCPLACFSMKLTPTEQKYSTVDRELLAVYYCAFRHFHHFLEACEFYVLTDNKPLSYNLNSKPDKHSPRKVCQLDFISQFTSNIRHVTRSDNTVVDALSSLEVNSVQLHSTLATVDFNSLVKAQLTNSGLQQIQSSNPALTLTRVSMPMCQDTLLCDTSTEIPQPYVPKEFRRKVFDSLHGLSHPGISATQCTAAELIYGTTLRLPGKYFHPHTNATLAPISYASQLKTLIQSLKPPPVRYQQQRNCYISDHLNNCHFVFVRHDPVKKPLQPPYDGPFRVLQHHNKHSLLTLRDMRKLCYLTASIQDLSNTLHNLQLHILLLLNH